MAHKFFYLYFLPLVLLILPSVGFCATESNVKWEFYGKSKTGNTYYYSVTGATASPDVVSVWSYKTVTDDEKKEKIESVKKENPEDTIKYRDYAYSISKLEVDCPKKISRAKEIILYSTAGRILDDAVLNSEWEKIAPGSIGEMLYQKICVGGKKPVSEPPRTEPNAKPAAETKKVTPEPVKSQKSDKDTWIEYGKFKGSVYAYNKNSIKRTSNNIIQVWRKLTYSDAHRERDIQMLVKTGAYSRKQLEKLWYDVTLDEIDCKKNRARSISITCYDTSNNVILQRSNDKAKWQFIVPKSHEYYLKQQVCD